MAHVRHGEGIRLAGRPGRYPLHDEGGASRCHRTRELRHALLQVPYSYMLDCKPGPARYRYRYVSKLRSDAHQDLLGKRSSQWRGGRVRCSTDIFSREDIGDSVLPVRFHLELGAQPPLGRPVCDTGT